MILWIWLGLIIAILIWVERNSGHNKVKPHHDSMPYSYYQTAHRIKKDNNK